MNTILEQEMSGVVAEYKPLLDVCAERHMIREIKICREGYGAAIDESVLCLNVRAVGLQLLALVYRLISGECRHTTVEVEGLRVVADNAKVVADLSCKLCHRDTSLLTVGLIGLEVCATEKPSVSIVALDD